MSFLVFFLVRGMEFSGDAWQSTARAFALDRAKVTFSLFASVQLRRPSIGEGANGVKGGGEICLTLPILWAGFRLLVPQMVREILNTLNLAPSQITPNGWRILTGIHVIWPGLFKNEGRLQPTVAKFLFLYTASPANLW